MDDVIFLYVTAPDKVTAESLAEMLVGDRHAACVNIIPAIRSVYRWNDVVERADETAMIVKTTASKAVAARTAIERAHPYAIPVIAAIGVDPARSGSAFVSWISREISETNS